MQKAATGGNQLLKNIRPHLENFWYYAKVELAPPKLSEIPQMAAGVGRVISGLKSGSWKQLTVKQAFLNSLVATEVFCWFFIGECIGKRHFVGYDLSAAHANVKGHH